MPTEPLNLTSMIARVAITVGFFTVVGVLGYYCQKSRNFGIIAFFILVNLVFMAIWFVVVRTTMKDIEALAAIHDNFLASFVVIMACAYPVTMRLSKALQANFRATDNDGHGDQNAIDAEPKSASVNTKRSGFGITCAGCNHTSSSTALYCERCGAKFRN